MGMPPRPDPYQTLGVSRSADDAEVRAAYRRLVQLHHPDHNGGSPESARRFEEVQEAYAEVRRRRKPGGRATPSGRRRASDSGSTSAAPGDDSDIGSRLAAMESECGRPVTKRCAGPARRPRRRRPARQGERERPSDEELGYISTDDSFAKILSDAASGISDRVTEAEKDVRGSPVTKRFADLIDELGSKLSGEPPDKH